MIINDQIFNLPIHTGENSTFDLQFRGPQLQCTSASYNNTFSPERDNSQTPRPSFEMPIFESTWDWTSRLNQDSRDVPLYSVAKHEPLNYTARRTPQNITSFEILRTTTELICKPQSVLYDVKISFPRGTRTIQHTTSDVRMLLPMKVYTSDEAGLSFAEVPVYEDIVGPVASLRLPTDTQSLQNWNHRMRKLLPLATDWTLLDALVLLLQDEDYSEIKSSDLETGHPWCSEIGTSTNGTTFFDCGSWISQSSWGFGGTYQMTFSCKSEISFI